MAKTLEEVKALLAEKKIDDLYGDIVTLVESEKSRGIEEKRKVNSEAQSLRKYKIAVEKMIKDSGVDSIDDVDSFLSEILSKAKDSDINKASVKDKNELLKRIDSMEKKLLAKEKESIDASNRSKIVTIRSKLMSDLKDEIHAPEDVIQSRLIGRGIVELSDDGETVQFVNGEERIDYKTGLDNFLAKNQDIRKNKQIKGSGNRPANNNGITQKTLTLDALDKMSGRERAGFFASGGQVED